MKFAIKFPEHVFYVRFERRKLSKTIGSGSLTFDAFSMRSPLLATLRQIYYIFFCNIRRTKKNVQKGKHFQTDSGHIRKLCGSQKKNDKERELLGHKNGNVINHLTQISAIWLVYVTQKIACLQIDHNYCWLFTTASVNWTLSGDVFGGFHKG